MALRKKGHKWYIRFRVGKRIREIATGCSNIDEAKVVETNFKMKMRVEKYAKRLGLTVDIPPTPALMDDGRVPLKRMMPIAEKYRNMSKQHKVYWESFCDKCGCRYADEVTVQTAISYLKLYDNRSAKTYNNIKTILNTIFSLCIGETGVESPFAKIMPKINKTKKDHRCFTADELERLLSIAPPFWRFMVIVAKETGMPKESCLRFCPSMIVIIDGKPWCRYLRAKTSRFGRYCQVPLRKAVIDLIAPMMPGREKEKPFCDDFPHSANADSLSNSFSRLLVKAKISDTDDGIIDFHSLRSNFITMCDEIGVQRHATNGMVGHVQDAVTDLYSHDEKSPQKIIDYENVPSEFFR